MASRTSRRALVVGAVGSVVAAAGATKASGSGRTVYPDPSLPFGDPEKEVVTGVLRRHAGNSNFMLENDGGRILVRTSERTDMHIATRRVSVSDFVIGEELAVEGDYRGSTFQAKAVAPLMVAFHAEVLSRDGDLLETSSGRIRLAADAQLHHAGGMTSLDRSVLHTGALLGFRSRSVPGQDLTAHVVFELPEDHHSHG